MLTLNVAKEDIPKSYKNHPHQSHWQNTPQNHLKNYMGPHPRHFPETTFKIFYTEKAIHLLFEVKDRYVKAVAQENQGEVWKDSCVEFFFVPGPDVSKGYFNFEINCGGTFLFHFQHYPGTEKVIIPLEECSSIKVQHSLPKIITQEIEPPTTWSVEYQIPLDILRKFSPVVTPKAGVIWRANFYKCADDTSHPHWLTWSPVHYPKPNFHLPEFFGTLKFV